jgi:hypothetical protein
VADRDPEIAAMEAIVGALAGLDRDARDRVLAYVAQRLDLTDVSAVRVPAPPADEPSPVPEPGNRQVHDIRTLKAEKQPRSANEMAAVIAYYLAELASNEERKDTISKSDLEKYFKQAGYPLPKEIGYTLGNAAKAGYFDREGGGRFKLNPVGHNLVAHSLPTPEESPSRTRPRATRSQRTKAKPKRAGSQKSAKTSSSRAKKP